MGDTATMTEWARISVMHPFGARVDVDIGEGSTKQLTEDVVQQLGALLKRVMDEHALVVVTGLLPTAGFTPNIMDKIMDAFGPPEANITFGNTPLVDGEELVTGTSSSMPDHPAIRVLGNTRDKNGEPTALLANVGYVFHQDASEPYDCTSFLYCEKAPSKGAETLYAKCSTLYSRLSDEDKAFIETAVGVWSNRGTAGGPAALDSALGARMNATGTRRIRDSYRRHDGWNEAEQRRTLVAVDPFTGEKILSGCQPMGFDYFEGMDPNESKDKLESIMNSAYGPIIIGKLNDDLETVTETVWPDDVVMKVRWQPGWGCLWDNRRTTHSRTPIQIYADDGERRMWQLIRHREMKEGYVLQLQEA